MNELIGIIRYLTDQDHISYKRVLIHGVSELDISFFDKFVNRKYITDVTVYSNVSNMIGTYDEPLFTFYTIKENDTIGHCDDVFQVLKHKNTIHLVVDKNV